MQGMSGMKKIIMAAISLLILVLICGIFNNFFLYGFFHNKLDVSYASKISLTNDDALVVDSGGKRVVKFATNGTYSLLINSNSHTFDNANNVIEDAQGNIFVTDIKWADNGMDIATERILKFDKYGKLESQILTREYENKISRPNIYGVFLRNNQPYAIETTKDSFTLLSIIDNKVVDTVAFKDANIRISSFAIGENSIFFVDKKGVVYESANGVTKVRYENKVDNMSVPWQVAVNGENELFVSDIGKRQVLKITPDNRVTTIFDCGEGLEEKVEFAQTPIYYPVSVSENGNVGTVFAGNVFVKNHSGEVLQNTAEFKLAGKSMTLKVLSLTVMVIMCLILLYLLIRAIIGISKISVWKLSTKLSAIIVFVITITMIIVLPITYAQGRKMYAESSMEHLSSVVDMGSKLINVEALSKINSPGDYMNADYVALSNSVKEVVNRDEKHGERLYCLLYQVKDGVLYTPIFLDGTGGAFYPYDYKVEDSTLKNVFENGEIVEIGLLNESSGTWMCSQGPIYDRNNKVIGAIEVGLDIYSYQESYNKMYVKIIFSVIAAGIILQMILMQLLGMIDFFKKRKGNKMPKDREPIEFIGPLTFLMFFAFNLITAFIPVYSMKLYQPMAGLPTSFMQALPISLNLLAVVVGCAVSGSMINKCGIHKTGNIGSVFAILPYVALVFVHNYYLFTLVFVIAGFGTGMMQNAVCTYIATTKNETEQAQGFTSYNSAVFIGFNCGTVIGSLIAEQLGYNMVFIATAIFFFITAIIMFMFMRTNDKTELTHEKPKYNLFKFVFNPKIFLFFVCALIPFTVSNHFLFYFMPIYGESLGLSESLIGQLFLINGLCILGFSNILTKLTHEHLKDKYTILIAMCLVAVAFVIFALNQSLETIIVVLVFLGVASSFGAAAIRTYYTNQKLVKLYGEGKAMGAFATIENVGDTVGPMVFSFILAGTLRTNYFIASVIIVVLAVIYFIFADKTVDETVDKTVDETVM